jgi:hypothetical protein
VAPDCAELANRAQPQPRRSSATRIETRVGLYLLPCAVLVGSACGDSRSGPREVTENPAEADGGVPLDAGLVLKMPPRPLDGGLAIDAGLDDGKPVGDVDGAVAAPVQDFLRSIGVGAHIGQGVDDPARSATALAYAGITSLRERGTAEIGEALLMMHDVAGVRVDIQTNVEREGDMSIPNLISLAKKLVAAEALLAIEGPNEPNNYTVTYQGKAANWEDTFLPVAHYQRDLYQAVRAEPSLSKIPVFHSSTAGGTEPDNVGLQFLTIPAGAKTLMPDGTKFADYANLHNYVCGHSLQLVENQSWKATDAVLDGDWDGMFGQYGITWHKGFTGYPIPQLPTLPVVSTETGWVTRGKGAITEEQQGRLFLNLFFTGFLRGYDYTFIYMLRDDPKQGYWGLFDVDYEPKRSAVYLHNLTTGCGSDRDAENLAVAGIRRGAALLSAHDPFSFCTARPRA